jgi:hypothetical protein
MQLMFDCVPSLRVKGPTFLLMSVEDLGRCSDEHRRIFRFLTPAERFVLQGHDRKYAQLVGKKFALSLTGNAYPVPLLGAVLVPMVLALLRSGVLKSCAGRPAPLADEELIRMAIRVRRQQHVAIALVKGTKDPTKITKKNHTDTMKTLCCLCDRLIARDVGEE